MKTFAEKRFFEWHEDEVAVTLRNKSGSYGGGSEVLIVCDLYRKRSSGHSDAHNRGSSPDTEYYARPTDSGDI